MEKICKSVKKIVINTGNILNLNEIKKLTGHNQGDELIESLKITLSKWKAEDLKQPTVIQISRNEAEGVNYESLDRDSLKITVKIFILSANTQLLLDALNNVFETLKVSRIDSLVLACKLEPSAVLSALQSVWTVLESLVQDNAINDIGVSDVDTDVFIALYQWAQVKPRIIQINLAVCCVVPPILQEFCKENNVQLLTHSDPLDILPRSALYQVFSASATESLSLDWVVRCLTHIHSRGVLQSKGYLISVTRNTS